MTIEAWTRAPLALIQTQGPYTIPHPYASGAIRAIVLSEDGLRTELLPTDYTITPEASADTGTLTLTPAAFAIHEGRSLIIDRVTPEEQGWIGRLGQRERGLEAQLDLMVMAQQENRGGLNSALRLDYAVDPLPRVPNALVGLDGQGQPTMYELADPAVSIPVARYERVVSGDGTATPLPLPALAAGQGVVELYIWGIRQSPSVYRVTGGGRYVELRDGAVWPKGDQNIHIVQSSALVAAVESGEIFNSLEEAAAASIVAVRQHIAVLQDGRLLTYIREAGVSEDHAALITADGARWVPAAITARYNPASWGSGWTALWRCWEWQKAARGRIDLEIPPGMTITQPTSGATDYVTLTALNVPMSLVNLGRIIRMALAPVFAVAAGYVQPVAVTGILESETTVTLPEDEAGEGGTSTETQEVTTITLASLAGYEATTGMIAYITDDDATPLNPDGTPVLDGFGNPLTPGIPEHIVRRRGEPFVIWRAEAGTSGSPRTDLIVRKPLNFTYNLSANCRVWLLRTTPIDIFAGNIEDGNLREPGNPAYQPMIHIEAAQYPRVSGLITEYSGAHAVQFLQCYEPSFDKFRLGYIANQNNPWHTSGLARYGARFVNCAKAQVSDGLAGHVRHVVDFLSLDYTGYSYLKPDPALHPIGSGASMDCTVTDVLSWGATAPPFSTHDGTFRIKFANCHAIKPASWGFASRGVGHVFDGCSDTDANGLIHCFVGGRYIGRGTAITRDISVRNHTSINPRGMALVKVNDGCQSVMLANMVVRFTEDGTGLLQRIADIRTAADVSISGLRLDIRRPQGMDELFKISGTGVGGVIRWNDSEVIDWTGSDTIDHIIDNAGPAYLHMISGVRAYRADTQGQLIGALWTGTAPAAGSHIRDSRIVGLWSEDEVAPDRAAVLAAYVTPERDVIRYMDGETVVSLARATGGTAATLADGSEWEAEGDLVSPLAYGAAGDGTADDTAAVIKAAARAYAAGLRLDLSRVYLTTATIPYLHEVDRIGSGAIKVGSALFPAIVRQGDSITVYVDGAAGSDTNDGLASGARAVATLTAARNLIRLTDRYIAGSWTIRVAAATYTEKVNWAGVTSLGSPVTIAGPDVGHPNAPTAIIAAPAPNDNGFEFNEASRFILSNIAFTGFTSGQGINNNGGKLSLVNVHMTGCWKGIINQHGGQVTFSGGIYDGTGAVPADATGYSGYYNARHGVSGHSSTATGTIFRNYDTGLQIGEGTQGHLDYITVEDCADQGVDFKRGCGDCNTNQMTIRRNAVGIRAQNAGWYDNGIIWGTGADANAVKVRLSGDAPEFKRQNADYRFLSQRVAMDMASVASFSLTGSLADWVVCPTIPDWAVGEAGHQIEFKAGLAVTLTGNLSIRAYMRDTAGDDEIATITIPSTATTVILEIFGSFISGSRFRGYVTARDQSGAFYVATGDSDRAYSTDDTKLVIKLNGTSGNTLVGRTVRYSDTVAG